MTENTAPLLIELHYLPCLAYFSAIKNAETVFLETCENFQKQTCRNRCYLLGAHQIACLTIPVKHSPQKILICDVAIDYSQRWQPIHWRTIVSAYRKSPFFDYYIADFEKVFTSQPKFLFDFNEQLLTICLKSLKWSKSIKFTDTYNFLPEN
ncbi:MAG: WbqC family protein, partial [Verrucomicrobia bacterium]|nr:WbqC family protein [Cytophagales bacterium]